MKKKMILAALLMSMAVTVFAEEEVVWEEQDSHRDMTYAESVFEEEETVEQTASEEPEYVFDETAIIEEEIKDEDVVSEEIAFDENADQATELIQEQSVFEEQVVTEDVAGDEGAAVDESSSATAVAVEGLVYTGEPQELITAQEGSWTYSLDGVTYTEEIPTGVNAGEYTVYMKEGDAEVVVITVTIAKADVIFTPPVASSTITRSEAATARADGEEPAYADEPAYAVGEESDEVVFEVE